MRDDVDEKYTDEMREEIFDEVVLESIAENHQQELFPSLGDLIASGHARVPAAPR